MLSLSIVVILVASASLAFAQVPKLDPESPILVGMHSLAPTKFYDLVRLVPMTSTPINSTLTGIVTDIKINPKKFQAYTVSQTNGVEEVEFINTSTNTIIQKLPSIIGGGGHKLAVSPDGKRLVVAGYDIVAGTTIIYQWNLNTNTGDWAGVTPIAGTVRHMVYSPDSSILYTFVNLAVTVYNANTGSVIAHFPNVGIIAPDEVAARNDGMTFGSFFNMAQVLSLSPTPSITFVPLSGTTLRSAASTDGQHWAMTSFSSNTVDIVTGTTACSTTFPVTTPIVGDLSFGPKTNLLYAMVDANSGPPSRTVFGINPTTCQIVKTLPITITTNLPTNAFFTPDEKRLVYVVGSTVHSLRPELNQIASLNTGASINPFAVGPMRKVI